MQETQDVRWLQRFANYRKALAQLRSAVELAATRSLSDLEMQGLVQAFGYTYELAWNTIKDFYENQGETGIQGSRDAFRLAFRRGLVENGETWMQMIKDRARTSHTYNEQTVECIVSDILSLYYNEFNRLEARLSSRVTD
jgi:nucleotidyltransferase substrate binding protein (TIGR01987 family)